MNQDSRFLSSAVLKDKAKGALTGNYPRMILAILAALFIEFAFALLVSFLEAFLMGMFFILSDMAAGGLTQQQMLQLLSEYDFAALHPGAVFAGQIATTFLYNIFGFVMQTGLNFCFLNLACSRQTKISDIFYGFVNQPGKCLRLAAVFALISQIYLLPYEILNNMSTRDVPLQYLMAALALYLAGVVVYLLINLSVSQALFLFLDFPGYSAGELLRLSVRIMKGHKGRYFYLQISFVPLLLLNVLTLGIGQLWLIPYLSMTQAFFFLNLMQGREKQA